MPQHISAADASRQIQEELDLESEEDNHSSDESGDDTEDEFNHFELRLDPAEDMCDEYVLFLWLALVIVMLLINL